MTKSRSQALDSKLITYNDCRTSMRYDEFRPAEPLARLVKCFWVLESAAMASAEPDRILPDGCTEMVFHLGDPFVQYSSDDNSERQPLAMFVGQMRRHLLIKPTGRVEVLGVRFWPGGAYPVLAVPQQEIAGQVVDLESVWGVFTRELYSRICEGATPHDKVRQVEAFLLARLANSKWAEDGVTHAVRTIINSGGQVAVECLADNLGLGLRRLDRSFNTRVGLTPKTLCRIVRFQRVVRMIEQNETRRDWATIALDCGYYDQPHFIKDFSDIAGIGPTGYFTAQNPMSELFTASS